MSRIYTISAGGLTIANAPVTMAALFPGTTRAIQILRMWLAQASSITSAQQRVEWGLLPGGQPTVVSATPQPHEQADQASQITGISGTLIAGRCGVNASAEGGGTKAPMGHDAFNILNGWQWVPGTDLEVITLTPSTSSSFYLFLPVAAPTLTGWEVGLTYREIG